MRLSLLFCGLLALCSPALRADTPAAAVRLPLTHMLPSAFLHQLGWDQGAKTHLPEGIFQVTAVDADHTLIVEASQKGLEFIRQLTAYLDVKPLRVTLKCILNLLV